MKIKQIATIFHSLLRAQHTTLTHIYSHKLIEICIFLQENSLSKKRHNNEKKENMKQKKRAVGRVWIFYDCDECYMVLRNWECVDGLQMLLRITNFSRSQLILISISFLFSATPIGNSQ